MEKTSGKGKPYQNRKKSNKKSYPTPKTKHIQNHKKIISDFSSRTQNHKNIILTI